MKSILLAGTILFAVVGNAYAGVDLSPAEQRQIDLLQAQMEFVTAAKDKEIAILQAKIDFILNTAREKEKRQKMILR